MTMQLEIPLKFKSRHFCAPVSKAVQKTLPLASVLHNNIPVPDHMRHGMLNEKKIALMTKMAIYEQKEGRKSLPMSKYYRSDYISLRIINTAIVTTIAFFLIAGLAVLVRKLPVPVSVVLCLKPSYFP